jgi:hypothetical protein
LPAFLTKVEHMRGEANTGRETLRGLIEQKLERGGRWVVNDASLREHLSSLQRR